MLLLGSWFAVVFLTGLRPRLSTIGTSLRLALAFRTLGSLPFLFCCC